MNSGIYTITGPSGKAYVGQSSALDRRIAGHKTRLRRGEHHCRPLQAAWNKHGEAAFAFAVVMLCEGKNALNEAEQRYMDMFCGKGLYNLRPAAASNLGFSHSDETKARIAAAHARPETKAQMAAAVVAACARPDVFAKRSASQSFAKNRDRAIIAAKQREVMARPDVKAAHAAATKAACLQPEVRAKNAASANALWACPIKRARMMEARRAAAEARKIAAARINESEGLQKGTD